MTELEALRRVAEAARAFINARGAHPSWDVMVSAIRALDALPAPAAEPGGEVMEVAADVFRERDGKIVVRERGYMSLPNPMHIATIRARVPLPRVPEVVGEVG